MAEPTPRPTGQTITGPGIPPGATVHVISGGTAVRIHWPSFYLGWSAMGWIAIFANWMAGVGQ